MSRVNLRATRLGIGVLALMVAFVASPGLYAQNGQGVGAANGSAAPITPNYDLAAAWMPQRVARLVFDTSVTPRWLETSDRFWYAYNTR